MNEIKTAAIRLHENYRQIAEGLLKNADARSLAWHGGLLQKCLPPEKPFRSVKSSTLSTP